MTIAGEKFVAVTVTYGSRWPLLSRVLGALEHESIVDEVVVIDNGSKPTAEELIREIGFKKPTIIRNESNQGSAKAFGHGIEAALERGAEWVWILDDDNLPRPGALASLVEAYIDESAVTPHDQLAMLAFRPEHQADVAHGVPLDRVHPRPGSFRGFHILDIPYKIWRRTPWGCPHASAGSPARLVMPDAPYSGLLFRRELIDVIGLPNPEFVLYADDNEYTYRITRRGGRIVLVTGSRLDDLESSWNVKARFGNSFDGLLCGEGDFRAYYGMRNGTYYDYIRWRGYPLELWLNRMLYLAILYIFALLRGRRQRYRLLRQAIYDGLSGRLGMHPNFPL